MVAMHGMRRMIARCMRRWSGLRGAESAESSVVARGGNSSTANHKEKKSAATIDTSKQKSVKIRPMAAAMCRPACSIGFFPDRKSRY